MSYTGKVKKLLEVMQESDPNFNKSDINGP